MTQPRYDIAVIGLGLIGSAALRALSERGPGLRVLGVGPAEPSDWSSHAGPFASHYDHARITRVTDPDHIWASLARRSIDAYPTIEAGSGISFHHPSGHLRLGRGADDPSLAAAEDFGRQLAAPLERLDSAALSERFPYLRFPEGAAGLIEAGGAGWINPRALVAAQLTVAAKQGAELVREEVTALRRQGDGFALTTRSGATLLAAQVLVSAHGYSTALLEPVLGRPLALENQAHTTVYAELDPAQAAELAPSPSVIWPLEGDPVLPSVYTTPPARYPDGRWYLKIGGPLHTPLVLTTPEAIGEWFQGPGNPTEIAALQRVLQELYPGLQLRAWSSKPCMNSYTAHGYPYIDQLGEGLFVCTGGCGSAAKSSDAIGRLGAELARRGAWADELPREAFRAM
jgi:sarcosine oxidase